MTFNSLLKALLLSNLLTAQTVMAEEKPSDDALGTVMKMGAIASGGIAAYEFINFKIYDSQLQQNKIALGKELQGVRAVEDLMAYQAEIKIYQDRIEKTQAGEIPMDPQVRARTLHKYKQIVKWARAERNKALSRIMVSEFSSLSEEDLLKMNKNHIRTQYNTTRNLTENAKEMIDFNELRKSSAKKFLLLGGLLLVGEIGLDLFTNDNVDLGSVSANMDEDSKNKLVNEIISSVELAEKTN